MAWMNERNDIEISVCKNICVTVRQHRKEKDPWRNVFKGRNGVPGLFHSAVRSSSGDANETIALAIDQLRLLDLITLLRMKINEITFIPTKIL